MQIIPQEAAERMSPRPDVGSCFPRKTFNSFSLACGGQRSTYEILKTESQSVSGPGISGPFAGYPF
jgi:hypothetical protein